MKFTLQHDTILNIDKEICCLIDMIRIACGTYQDSDGKYPQ